MALATGSRDLGLLGGWLIACNVDGSESGITYLVDHAVPSVACVVDDDVDLAVAEVCGLLDERVDVFVVEHVSGDSECLAAALVDGVCDGLCFVCGVCVSYRPCPSTSAEDQELCDDIVL